MKPIDELKLQGNDNRGTKTSEESYSSAAAAGDRTVEEAASATDYALSLLRGFRNGRGNNKAEVGSNGSNGGSDTNSGLVSFGNNSFLFQFDGEEGGLTNGSFPTSESDNKIGGSDSDGEGRDSRSSGDGPRIDPHTADATAAEVSHSAARTVSSSSRATSSATRDPESISALHGAQGPNALSIGATGSTDELAIRNSFSNSGSTNTNSKRIGHPSSKSSISSLTMSSHNDPIKNTHSKGEMQKSFAREGNARLAQSHHHDGVVRDTIHSTSAVRSSRLDQHNVSSQLKTSGLKRRMDSECGDDNDSMEGYSSDDEGIDTNHAAHRRPMPNASGMPSNLSSHVKGIIPEGSTNTSVSSGRLSASHGDDAEADHPTKRKKTDDHKREERNAREKERSFRISKQINELRALLSSGGVIVPKGTKSSVLTEAANYIRMLQQHQCRSEIDRHQLVQQMQQIGNGALGPQAANAIRVVAAQNGVWSLGNFGGLPPQTTSNNVPKQDVKHSDTQSNSSTSASQNNRALVTAVEENEYRHIFHSCSIAMAVATMGGLFVDCNSLFCQLSQYTKKEVCAMTIFTLTSRDDLQVAFDLISQMITPSAMSANQHTQCVLRGSMKHRKDLGLSISLIKGEDGIAKYFCVTLIQNPTSPFDTSKPVPATATMISPPSSSGMDPKASDQKGANLSNSATLTSG